MDSFACFMWMARGFWWCSLIKLIRDKKESLQIIIELSFFSYLYSLKVLELSTEGIISYLNKTQYHYNKLKEKH